MIFRLLLDMRVDMKKTTGIDEVTKKDTRPRLIDHPDPGQELILANFGLFLLLLGEFYPAQEDLLRCFILRIQQLLPEDH